MRGPEHLAPGELVDGRDPARVPANWAELLDPGEWALDDQGLPARRAARVLVLRDEPEPGILLVIGHDFARSGHSWAFTPGGGIMVGESVAAAARRELAEETGIELDAERLVGPVVERESIFSFHLVTCRQDEVMFLAHLTPGETDALEAADGELDRAGWTDLERDVLDSVRWWSLEELDEAVAGGMTVYPQALPQLAHELVEGWDGRVRRISELS